jgi:hypothetical protein
MNKIFSGAALLMMLMMSACLQETPGDGVEQTPPQAVESSELSSPLATDTESALGKEDDVTAQCEPFCCEWDYEGDYCRIWAGCLPGGMISYCP